MRLMALLAVLALVACGDSEPELPELVEQAPAATVAPTLLPEPDPTPTPEGDLGRAAEIALAWVAANPDKMAEMVVEAVLASEDAEDLPLPVRATFGSLLQASVTDQMGNQLSATIDGMTAYSDGTAVVVVVFVEGRVTDLGAVSAVEVLVPMRLTVDLAAEDVTRREVGVLGSTVTIELGG